MLVDVHRNATVILIDLALTTRAQPRHGVDDTEKMLSFQNLDVYKCSIEFLAFTRRLLHRLPKGHADLVDQLRRSARSITQNIAEGAGKATRADKAKHYTIARGSAMESAAHLDVMKVDELIELGDYARGSELLERIVAMLTRMMDL